MHRLSTLLDRLVLWLTWRRLHGRRDFEEKLIKLLTMNNIERSEAEIEQLIAENAALREQYKAARMAHAWNREHGPTVQIH